MSFGGSANARFAIASRPRDWRGKRPLDGGRGSDPCAVGAREGIRFSIFSVINRSVTWRFSADAVY